MMKKCFKCLEEKSVTDFYRHKFMADGFLNKCKSCTKKDVLAHRDRNIEKIREYDRGRSKTEPRRSILFNYRAENKEKVSAQKKVQSEIRAGRLVRWPCEVCGEQKVDAHHPTYSLPMLVVWLCRKHHSQAHRQTDELKRVESYK